jgi:hypothetical protein
MRLTRRGRRIATAVTLVAMALIAVLVVTLLLGGSPIVRTTDPCATPPPLRTRHGVTLQPSAMRAFRRAERLAGRRIPVVQSYRSCSQQAMACRNICGDANGCPGRCASPGTSYHQLGAAVDITETALHDPTIVSALRTAGWCQSVPDNDPGHFSFDGCH